MSKQDERGAVEADERSAQPKIERPRTTPEWEREVGALSSATLPVVHVLVTNRLLLDILRELRKLFAVTLHRAKTNTSLDEWALTEAAKARYERWRERNFTSPPWDELGEWDKETRLADERVARIAYLAALPGLEDEPCSRCAGSGTVGDMALGTQLSDRRYSCPKCNGTGKAQRPSTPEAGTNE